MKKVTISILILEIILLLSYVTSFLAWLNPPNVILFPVWFLIALSGIGFSIYLFAKKKYTGIALVMIILGFFLFAIGALMRLFLTM